MAIDPLSLGLGGLSLIGGKNSAKKKDKALAKAGKVTDWEFALKKLLTGEAMNHNYGQDTSTAVNSAAQVTQNTLQKAMTNLDATYRSGGGQPTGDSEFKVLAQSRARRITDPLSLFAADMKANEFTRRMNAILAAAGAGGPAGQIASNYMNMANSYNPNFGAGLDLLAGGLGGIPNPFGGKKVGSGNNPDNTNYGGYY